MKMRGVMMHGVMMHAVTVHDMMMHGVAPTTAIASPSANTLLLQLHEPHGARAPTAGAAADDREDGR